MVANIIYIIANNFYIIADNIDIKSSLVNLIAIIWIINNK